MGSDETDERYLFELPSDWKAQPREQPIRRLKYPVWTESKARLIERYLYYFVLITKHGTYIDGFAGPQHKESPSMDLVAWIIPKDVLSLCFSTLGIT